MLKQSLVRVAERGFTTFSASLPTLRKKESYQPNPLHLLTREAVPVGNRIITSLADRWVGLGMTGCGKTTWALQLVSRLREHYPAVRTYILDSKGEKALQSYPGTHIESQKAPDALRVAGGIQIWSPPLDDISEYDLWFTRILKARQPALVLVDELGNLGGVTGRTFPRGYLLLNKQGRGLDISLISLTQEAAYIPRQTLGQLTHLLRFKLLNDYDRRAGDKLLGRLSEERKDPYHTYGFFYRNMTRPSECQSYKNWQEFFRSTS